MHLKIEKVHPTISLKSKNINSFIFFGSLYVHSRKSTIRGRSQTTLKSFGLFLTTYLLTLFVPLGLVKTVEELSDWNMHILSLLFLG